MKKDPKLQLDRRNIKFFLFGIAIVTLGYIIMRLGDRTISPLLLIIAYVFIIPISLILPVKNDKNQ